ncbi:MAG: DUF4132 domain-containing protein [Streptomyces sp.]|nr:DUF4132 domain-containing protein [Streptomyces sp.]
MAILLAARLNRAMARDGKEVGQEVAKGGREFAETQVGRLVLGLSEPDRRAAALHLHKELCLSSHRQAGEWAVRVLATLPLRWTPQQAEELLGRVTGRLKGVRLRTYGMLALPVAALECAEPADREGLRAGVAELSRWLPLVPERPAALAGLRRRVDALLPPDGSGLHWSVLDGDDAYGPRMRAEHAGLLASPGVGGLLTHCATLEQVRAGVRWQATAAELIAAAPRGPEAVRELLVGFAAQPECRCEYRGSFGEVGVGYGLTGRSNTALVRGLLWVLAGLATAGTAGGTAGVAAEEAVRLAAGCAMNAGTGIGGRGGTSRSEQVANTAVAVLAGFDGEPGGRAAAELAALRRKVRNRTVLKGAERAQQEIAGRAGVVPSQLRERVVPAAGLDAEHRREVVLPDGSTAVLAVDAAGAASLSFRTAKGRRVASPPASAKREAAAEVAALKGELKELRRLLAAERARLEELLASGASWNGADWQRLYADHPVVGALAKALLWEVRPSDLDDAGHSQDVTARRPEAQTGPGPGPRSRTTNHATRPHAQARAGTGAAAQNDTPAGTGAEAQNDTPAGIGAQARTGAQAQDQAANDTGDAKDQDGPGTGARGGRAGGDGWWVGVPERAGAGWVLAGADGTATPVTAADTVRMWHPLRAAAADVAAWRTEVTDRELRQPFKQAFREVYLLTPAEEATGGYSNRFAGRVLRFGQARSLMGARGWSASQLGFWDGGYEGEAVRPVPAAGPLEWRARFDYQAVEEAGMTRSGTADLCSSNRVRFERRPPGARWTPVTLAEVPPLVLSEALRDVDLFVGVASIAADPRWRDSADGRMAGSWREAAFGPLPPSAQVRAEALARLLPRTRIAGRVELDGRFLRVRGDRTAYRIHLGSANVLMEPHDAYLCIVPARRPSAAAGRVFLPFEEDGGVLAEVLSKAFLLADDAAITDPSIVAQLPPLPADAGQRGERESPKMMR